MNKVLLLTLVVSLICFGSAFSQVVADFETDASGFIIGWGNGITGLSQMADPSGESDGVLAMSYNADLGDTKGAIKKPGKLEYQHARLIAYYVWLPANTPDNLLIKVWAQAAGWQWNDDKYYARDIKKETWYPIYFNSEKRDLPDGPFEEMGIEVYGGELSGEDTSWTGDIYFDNVSLIGVEPKVIADFETDLSSFVIGWGNAITSLTQVADPSGESAGVMAIDIDADMGDTKAAVKKPGPVDHMNANLIAYYIWLPANTPDNLLIKVWAQGAGWQWNDDKYYASDITKETWFPIYFNPEIRDMPEGDYEEMGLEIYGGELSGDDTTFAETIYIDNVSLLTTETGKKWVVADFENEIAGTQGFASTNWDPGLTSVNWLADPSGVSAGVMETQWAFDASTSKGSLQNGNVTLEWSDEGGTVDTGATHITFDVWPDEGIPSEGSQLSIWVQDHESWTWTEEKFSISDSTVIPGQWNTISYPILPRVEAGTVSPFGTVTVGLQLYYSVSNTWSGSVYIDNFTLLGVEAPEGGVQSPTIAVTVDTSTTSDPNYQAAVIEWADSGPGTEKYNVYMSESPINDVESEGVIRLTNDIPHGEQYWVHRPYSTDGGEMTFYYAVTAIASDGTETGISGENVSGPVTLSSTATAKANYVADFASVFSLDGLDTEFQPYADHKLNPENANGPDATDWTVESTDMTWGATFIIDDDYLYISADVTDDDLNAEGDQPKFSGTQPWMGDALEIFLGYYNVNMLDDYHNYNDVDAPGTGDWRIAFTAWGTTGTATDNQADFPGVEATVFQKFSGDGYIIEARIALDSLALDHDFETVDGAMLPMQVNGNDLDPTNNDSSRTLQANWGTQSGHEGWKRPGAWGFLEVINGPVGIEDESDHRLTYELFANYPNPFNPVTAIRFQVPEQADVKIQIYDILGNKVRTLYSGKKQAGTHELQWDGRNDAGVPVTSGIYFCNFKANNFNRTQKMMLIK